MSEVTITPAQTASKSDEALTLHNLQTGAECVRIVKFGGSQKFRSKMLALGLFPGQKAHIMKYHPKEPCMLKVGDTNIVLDWDSTKDIQIEVISKKQRRFFLW